MEDISQNILSFHEKLKADQHHRYKSWEHCYSYFSGKEIDVDHACLHLSFYLASWGMHRGSSFLLWKDYLIHKKVVEELISKRHLRNPDFSQNNEKIVKEVMDLIRWVKKWYGENITHVNEEQKTVNVTDTLATKILLGTIGCIPAYDRYFIDGLRKEKICYSSLSPKNFDAVIKFYQQNKPSFDFVQSEIMRDSRINYPTMKLVDMYFWQIGFDADNPPIK